jgi:hypothetical protein
MFKILDAKTGESDHVVTFQLETSIGILRHVIKLRE